MGKSKRKKNYTTDWTVWELLNTKRGLEDADRYVRVATFHCDFFHAKKLAQVYINNHAEQHRNYYRLLPAGVEPKEAVK